MFNSEDTYTITANKDACLLDLCKFFRKVFNQEKHLKDCLELAKTIKIAPLAMGADLFNCRLKSNDLIHVECNSKQNQYYSYAQECSSLMELGAAGDAECAIEYCKRVLAGKAINAPFA